MYTIKEVSINLLNFKKIWKEEVWELLSDISDFLGVLRKMAEITTGVFLDRDLTKYDPEIAQICRLIYAFNFVKNSSICD